MMVSARHRSRKVPVAGTLVSPGCPLLAEVLIFLTVFVPVVDELSVFVWLAHVARCLQHIRVKAESERQGDKPGQGDERFNN